VARRKRERNSVERWSEDAASVWVGLADWRAAHPKATFREIESELDVRLNQVRARVLADLALASAAADLRMASRAERPCCTACGTVLHARGSGDRTLLTPGGAEVRLERTYATCPRCGDGSFPPGR